MQRISLRMLSYLEAAARHGNMTGSAKEMNVSQSSVSGAIGELEEIVGVPLLVRHHARGVSLTPAGSSLVNDARLLLNHARDFEKRALSLSDAIRGEIAFGCFVTLAPRFMPTLLARFAQAYPGIEVKLFEGSQDEIVEMLLSGYIELGLSYHSALRPEIAAEYFGELPPHALLATNHKLAKRRSVGLAELSRERFILLDLPFSREYFLNLFRQVGVTPQIAFRFSSPELIRGLVAHGHGFTIHNAISKTMMTNDGTPIAVIPIRDELPGSRLMCLRLKRQTARPAVRIFQKFLAEAFSPRGAFGRFLRIRR